MIIDENRCVYYTIVKELHVGARHKVQIIEINDPGQDLKLI